MTVAHCLLCKPFMKHRNGEIDLSNMGFSALVSHANGVKHAQKIKDLMNSPMLNFVVPQAPTLLQSDELEAAANTSTTVGPASTSQCSASFRPATVATTAVDTSLNTSVMLNAEISKAEILWTLVVAEKHLSYRSCEGMADIFKVMFPTSAVADKFSMSRTKVRVNWKLSYNKYAIINILLYN